MLSSPKVAVIVLNWNGHDCLVDCLASLERLDYPNKTIIVVDNHSEDDSLGEAQRRFPFFTYIQNEENIGFAAGMNRGIRKALQDGAEWVWLFNYDAQTEENSLSLLLQSASHHSSGGLFSPIILKQHSDMLWFGKGKIDFFRMRAKHVTPSMLELSKDTYTSEFLTGCAMLIKKNVFTNIGLLDERFFLYYEDADFCLRAKRAGFTSIIVPKSVIRHQEKSLNNPKKLFHLVYSGLLFSKKNAPAYLRPYLWAYGTIRRMKNCINLFRGRAGAHDIYQAYKEYSLYESSSRRLDRHRQL